MLAEVVAAVLASSLALLSDAAHMLTDAVALAVALGASRTWPERPARGAMTYGLGRAEILSAQANGVTLLVLGVLIVVDAIQRLVLAAGASRGFRCSIVALAGIGVNLARGHDPRPVDRTPPARAASTSKAPTATSSPTCTASSRPRSPPW